MKKRLYKILEKGAHGAIYNRVFDYFIMCLILLNVISVVLETIPEIQNRFSSFLKQFEVISIIIFSIEYMLRIYISDITHPSNRKYKSILKFIFSPFGIIDLLAILPFYLPFVFTIDLRFLRIIRFLRFIRIFKLNRYNKSLNLISSVIKEKRMELGLTFFVTFLIILIASFIMFEIESKVQPNAFPNILASFWWAVATLTTVGYGDIYPITGLGKLLSGAIAIVGIGLVALPTGIISSGLIEKIKLENTKDQDKKGITCPHCGEKIEKKNLL